MARPGPAVSRSNLTALAAGLVACASLLLVPVDSPAWVLIARGTGVVAVIGLTVGVLRMPARERAVWWLIWAYATLTVAADVVYDYQQRVQGVEPFPGPADALYLAAYASAIAGLLLLARRVIPGRDRDAWIDAMIMTIAIAAVIWYLVARPIVAGSHQDTLGITIVLAYPFLDIVVLAGLFRLVFGGGRSTVAVTFLIAGFLLTLAADLTYNIVVSNGADDFSPPLLDATFLAAIVLMSVAAWTPDAHAIDAPATRPADASTSGRLVMLAFGTLAIPTLLIVATWGLGDATIRVLTVASIGVILLVVWRLERVLSTVRQQNDLLNREARTDALTGLPNRRTLDHELTRAIEQADLSGSDLTVAMLDLDHFKAYNDQHGHQAGDQVLVTCARAWRNALPATAFLARYGGEEFAVLLPGVDQDDAPAVLDTLRSAMPPHRTVSIGYAVRDARESDRSVLRRADSALYEAKEAGRDRIVAAW